MTEEKEEKTHWKPEDYMTVFNHIYPSVREFLENHTKQEQRNRWTRQIVPTIGLMATFIFSWFLRDSNPEFSKVLSLAALTGYFSAVSK